MLALMLEAGEGRRRWRSGVRGARRGAYVWVLRFQHSTLWESFREIREENEGQVSLHGCNFIACSRHLLWEIT